MSVSDVGVRDKKTGFQEQGSGIREQGSGIRIEGGSGVSRIKLPGKVNSNSHGVRPVHQTISMIKWIRTSRLSIMNSLSHLGRVFKGAEEASIDMCFAKSL